SLGSDLVTIGVADADIDNLRIPLVPTATVIGRVVLSANLRANLSELKVSLVRTRREVDLRYQTNVAADGTFTLGGVGPGIFDAFIDSLPPGAYARSIRYAGRDALLNGLDVNPNSNPLEIVLATGSVAQGRVLDRKGDP